MNYIWKRKLDTIYTIYTIAWILHDKIMQIYILKNENNFKISEEEDYHIMTFFISYNFLKFCKQNFFINPKITE